MLQIQTKKQYSQNLSQQVSVNFFSKKNNFKARNFHSIKIQRHFNFAGFLGPILDFAAFQFRGLTKIPYFKFFIRLSFHYFRNQGENRRPKRKLKYIVILLHTLLMYKSIKASEKLFLVQRYLHHPGLHLCLQITNPLQASQKNVSRVSSLVSFYLRIAAKQKLI